MSRVETEQRLETAALKLLWSEGVLAGLNLRSAAENAGVNRGSVYHYFGSRRQLLKSALLRRLGVNYRTVSTQRHHTLADQVSWMFRYMVQQKEAVDIAALLVLDGDDQVEIMAFRREVLGALEALQARGELAETVNIQMLHVLLTATTRGYVLHRSNLAHETNLSTEELDEKILDLLLQTLHCLR